jgi:hypothetical protein
LHIGREIICSTIIFKFFSGTHHPQRKSVYCFSLRAGTAEFQWRKTTGGNLDLDQNGVAPLRLVQDVLGLESSCSSAESISLPGTNSKIRVIFESPELPHSLLKNPIIVLYWYEFNLCDVESLRTEVYESREIGLVSSKPVSMPHKS